MTIILPVTTTLLAIAFILIWSHFGIWAAVGLTLIVVMASLIHSIEPNLRL